MHSFFSGAHFSDAATVWKVHIINHFISVPSAPLNSVIILEDCASNELTRQRQDLT